MNRNPVISLGDGVRVERTKNSSSSGLRHAHHYSTSFAPHLRFLRMLAQDSRMVNITTLVPDFVAAIRDETLPDHVTLFDLASGTSL